MDAPNDPTVAGDESLLRRVIEDENSLVFDKNRKRWRPTSAAFVVQQDGISVYLASTLRALRMGPRDVAIAGKGDLVFAVTARTVRAHGGGVVSNPEIPVNHPVGQAHALITVAPAATRGQRKRLARAVAAEAELVHGEITLVEPPDPE